MSEGGFVAIMLFAGMIVVVGFFALGQSSLRTEFERCVLTSIKQKHEVGTRIDLDLVPKEDLYRCVRLNGLVGEDFQ